MQVSRNETTLAGGEEENILTGEYTLLPREKNTPEQLCALAREYYSRNFDFEPPETALMDNGDGTYTIHLYELVTLDQGETHTATSAWYTVDAYGDGVRPHIVFFGEDVPNFEPACRLAAQAHVFVVIGTTLSVYPAAALLRYAPASAQVYYIDPNPASVPSHVHVIAKKATEGVKELIQMLTK